MIFERSACVYMFRYRFIHHWSVNLKFVPEDYFTSTTLSVGLLALHLAILCLFTSKWSRASNLPKPDNSNSKQRGGNKHFHKGRIEIACLEPLYILEVLFVTNFVGVVFARSLHYQFYTW